MLFNSHEFLFAFLPVALGLFFLAGAASRGLALAWLTLVSLAFYAWWRPLNVLLIAPSLLVNYLVARALVGMVARDAASPRARWLLAAGVAFNVLFLGYFKYYNFAAGVLHDVTGASFTARQIVLPLGVSFITFQKIAFLVDVHAGRVKDFTWREYLLFVLFFPQLIAGPIVHYRELMPQLRAIPCRPDRTDLAVGLTLLVLGLVKKVALADAIAPYVAPVFGAAEGGGAVGLLPAWMAAVGFTLQIYFDFSGYSDMALGLARLFGVRLPLNFDSPLQASSIIDFWLRWHVTLTRFLTAYIYNPLALRLTRRRLARRLPVLGGRNPSPSAFLSLLAGPTLLTMLVSGLWHGAGYNFLVWGLLHGLYLVANHAWRMWVVPRLGPKAAYERVMEPLGFVLTFLAVVVAMVVFRGPTLGAAVRVWGGMAGAGGLVAGGGEVARLLLPGVERAALLLAIALLLPSSLQLLERYEPALGFKARPSPLGRGRREPRWQPTLPWAVVAVAFACLVVMRLGGKSEFLYWQF